MRVQKEDMILASVLFLRNPLVLVPQFYHKKNLINHVVLTGHNLNAPKQPYNKAYTYFLD